VTPDPSGDPGGGFLARAGLARLMAEGETREAAALSIAPAIAAWIHEARKTRTADPSSQPASCDRGVNQTTRRREVPQAGVTPTQVVRHSRKANPTNPLRPQKSYGGGVYR
jgi:hypothetical protein